MECEIAVFGFDDFVAPSRTEIGPELSLKRMCGKFHSYIISSRSNIYSFWRKLVLGDELSRRCSGISARKRLGGLLNPWPK